MRLIRGLTLTHPWAWAVLQAGKDVENRSWRPERQGGKVGMFLAIHGGSVPGGESQRAQEARAALSHALRLSGRAHPYNETQLLGFDLGEQQDGEKAYFTPGIVAVATLAFVTERSTSLWAVPGQVHWGLADVTPLPEAVAHRGAQGLWEISPGALQQVRDGYQAARTEI